jgi:broad specificity phosphatase PhoE
VNLFAIRHGETAWSLSGQHTGTTDLPLTDNGRRLAERIRPVLAREAFALVLVSPLQRARETCELAGLGDAAVIEPDLVEWNYGDYEGLTPKQIRETAPGWLVFRDGCPGGEAPEQVGARADRVIALTRGERRHDGRIPAAGGAVGTEPGMAKLLEQYGCGPIHFTGTGDALYDDAAPGQGLRAPL